MTHNTCAIEQTVDLRNPVRWDTCSLGYTLLLIVIAVAAVCYPTGNYDGVFYTALTVRATDARTLQRAGLEYERHLPQTVPSSYGDNMRSDPDHFVEQLPYYSVKPLYLSALGLARKVGFRWRSGALVSSVSYCVLGWLLWRWLRRYFGNTETLVLAILLILNPSLLRLIRWTSPDVMGILAVMAGVYLIVEADRPVSGIGLLLVAIWIRPETVIFSGLVICAAYLRHKLSLIEAGVLSILALGSYAIITQFGGFSYGTLFYNTFIERMNAPAESVFVITRSSYLHVLVSSLQVLFFVNPMVIFPFLVIAIDYFVLKERDMYSALLVAALFSSVILYGAFPHMDARYYYYQWVLIPALVLLIHTKRAVTRTCRGVAADN
ncbi:MAG: hypothetical protein WAM69_17215 [Candidatus Sulfotelmatobacter sp.]